jgi:lauroyl/myristoyl acyltransferase
LIAPGDVEYLAALALATGLKMLPAAVRIEVIHHLSRALGAAWYKTNRGAVRRVRRHLQFLFDYDQETRTLEALVRSQLALASWNALIINLLPSLSDEGLSDLLEVEGLRHVDEIRGRGEAVLLLGFHYGAYGYAAAATLAARGYPTRLVAYGDSHAPRPGTSRLYRQLYWPRVQRLTQKVGVVTVDPGSPAQPELYDVLEQKVEIVHLLADQYFVVPPGQDSAPHLARLHLLNRTVHLDVSGLQLAKRMGARPLTALAMRDSHRQRLVIEPLPWASAGTTSADIALDLQAYLARLERQLLADPAWWRDLRRVDLLPRLGVLGPKETVDG